MIDSGWRTSTNAALAGGLAVIVISLLRYFAPEFMASSPDGLEIGLAGVFVWLIARASKTPATPGKL